MIYKKSNEVIWLLVGYNKSRWDNGIKYDKTVTPNIDDLFYLETLIISKTT